LEDEHLLKMLAITQFKGAVTVRAFKDAKIETDNTLDPFDSTKSRHTYKI
jgi:hypothetical protein